MAKIHEEVIVIKLSKLVKNTEDGGPLSNDEVLSSLETIVQELVGSDVVVEVESA